MALVIYMFIMFYFFFLRKAENKRLKKKPVGHNFVIFLLLFKIGSLGPVDQQINLVLPSVFQLKLTCDHFYITIIEFFFFNWNTTSIPYLEMLLIRMLKLLFLLFLIDRDV